MIVIQLSDPHILAPGELLYRRFDTAEFLARAVAEINRLDPLPDVAVVYLPAASPGYAFLRCRSSVPGPPSLSRLWDSSHLSALLKAIRLANSSPITATTTS